MLMNILNGINYFVYSISVFNRFLKCPYILYVLYEFRLYHQENDETGLNFTVL